MDIVYTATLSDYRPVDAGLVSVPFCRGGLISIVSPHSTTGLRGPEPIRTQFTGSPAIPSLSQNPRSPRTLLLSRPAYHNLTGPASPFEVLRQ